MDMDERGRDEESGDDVMPAKFEARKAEPQGEEIIIPDAAGLGD